MNPVEKIERTLPNGFHDAHLLRVDMDYVARRAVVLLDVQVSVDRSTAYRTGNLVIEGVHYLVIDPPGPNAHLKSTGVLMIDSGPGQPSTSTIDLPPVPTAHFQHWFFVNDWNAFIRIAATHATFEWIDGKS